LLSLVRLDNILNDIFFILNIDSEHLYGLAFAFYHFADLRLKHLFQILNPNIVYILFSFYDS